MTVWLHFVFGVDQGNNKKSMYAVLWWMLILNLIFNRLTIICESGALGGGSLGPSIAGSVLNKSEPPPQPTKEDPDGPPCLVSMATRAAAAHGMEWMEYSCCCWLRVCARAPMWIEMRQAKSINSLSSRFVIKYSPHSAPPPPLLPLLLCVCLRLALFCIIYVSKRE